MRMLINHMNDGTVNLSETDHAFAVERHHHSGAVFQHMFRTITRKPPAIQGIEIPLRHPALAGEKTMIDPRLMSP